MLELKDKQKECQLHSRPLELFCTDQKKPYCIECMIETGIVPKNSIKFSAINAKAEKLKANVGDINIRKEESRKKFISLLQDKEKSLKRHLDEEFDKILEPIMKLKKKLRRDIDILVLSQEDVYDRENSLLKDMMTWKTEKEGVLEKWTSTISPDTELIKQLVDDPKDRMEEEELNKFAVKLETSKNTFDQETDGVKNTILSVVGGINIPWEIIEKQVKGEEAKVDPVIFEKRERKHLKECLETHGFKALWKKESGNYKLQINQGDLSNVSLSALDHHFYPLLESLEAECFDLPLNSFQRFCSILERSDKLSSFTFTSCESSDFQTDYFCPSLSALKNLETLRMILKTEDIPQDQFYELWAAISHLPSLGNLKINVNYNSNQRNNQEVTQEKPFGDFKTLRQVDLSFLKSEFNQNDNLSYLWSSLQKSENLSKLKIYSDDCYQSFKNVFTTFTENLPKLQHLQDLSLGLRKTQRFFEESQFVSLSQALNQLPQLTTLNLSITEHERQTTANLAHFLKGIDGTKLTQLKALRLDLSENKFFNDEALEKISSELVGLTSLSKFMLEIKNSHISGGGICKFISTSLSQLTRLQTVIIDCQNCSNINEDSKEKALEALNKYENIKEKHIIWNSGQIKMIAQKLPVENTTEEMSSFDAYLSSYFTQSNQVARQNNDDESDDEDAESQLEAEEDEDL